MDDHALHLAHVDKKGGTEDLEAEENPNSPTNWRPILPLQLYLCARSQAQGRRKAKQDAGARIGDIIVDGGTNLTSTTQVRSVVFFILLAYHPDCPLRSTCTPPSTLPAHT